MRQWAMAAALRGRNAIVVDATRVAPATSNDLSLTLFHETVHLALFQLERDRRHPLPIWFHEGVAQWLSGQTHLHTNRLAFIVAAAEGQLIPFDKLETRFPAERDAASLAYLQSEDFIGHIIHTRSREALRWILDEYRQGVPFDYAFEKALGISRRKMEKDWAGAYRRGHSWLRVLWEVSTLTGVMAILTILAYIAVRLRARRLHREWEREEAWTVVPNDDNPSGEAPPESDEHDPSTTP